MPIATFSPAIKATSERDGMSRIIVAVDEGPRLLCIDMDGRFEWLEPAELIVDLRYDPKTQAWTDPTEEKVSE